MGYYGYGFPKYVSVAEKKQKNARALEKLRKKMPDAKPITVEGRTIAKTFWGKAWCNNIETYRDFAYRLERGRSYLKSGAVLDLQISSGRVDALVAGSKAKPYAVSVFFEPLDKKLWENIKKSCSGKIQSLISLMQGKLPKDTLENLCKIENGLFPHPRQIKFGCTCADWAGVCKHIAAVMYGIGARFDEDPNLFFLLRGVDPKELIASSACIDNIVGSADSEIEEENLSDIFGIDLDDAANEKQSDEAEKGSAKKTHKAGSKSVDTPANKCGKSSLSLADYIASDIDVPTKKQNKLKKMQIADRYNDEDILPDITKKKRMGKKAYGTWTGADVKRLRESKGMTKIMFAKKLNITTYRLNKLESSSEPVSIGIVYALAKAFPII